MRMPDFEHAGSASAHLRLLPRRGQHGAAHSLLASLQTPQLREVAGQLPSPALAAAVRAAEGTDQQQRLINVLATPRRMSLVLNLAAAAAAPPAGPPPPGSGSGGSSGSAGSSDRSSNGSKTQGRQSVVQAADPAVKVDTEKQFKRVRHRLHAPPRTP